MVREADSEMEVRRERPSWKKLSEVLNGLTSEEPSRRESSGSKGAHEIFEKVKTFTQSLHKGFRGAQPITLGMNLEKAREELQRLKAAGSFEKYVKQTSEGMPRFRDPAHADQAWKRVLIDSGFDVVLPTLLELLGLVAQVMVERQIAKQREERRAAVRFAVDTWSKNLTDYAWKLWHDKGMPSAAKTFLEEARRNTEGAVAALEGEYKEIVKSLDPVRACLQELQKLPGYKPI